MSLWWWLYGRQDVESEDGTITFNYLQQSEEDNTEDDLWDSLTTDPDGITE